jgi:hypothetical protein
MGRCLLGQMLAYWVDADFLKMLADAWADAD